MASQLPRPQLSPEMLLWRQTTVGNRCWRFGLGSQLDYSLVHLAALMTQGLLS